MKLVALSRRDQNRAALDPWTVVHFAAGLALGLMNAPRGPAMIASVGYEVAEQLLERSPTGKRLFNTRGPEGVANVCVDLAVYYLGLRAGQRRLDSERTGPDLPRFH